MTISFNIKSSFVSTVTLWMAIIITQKHTEELLIFMLTNRCATGWKKNRFLCVSPAQTWHQIHSTVLQSWQAVNLIYIHKLPTWQLQQRNAAVHPGDLDPHTRQSILNS